MGLQMYLRDLASLIVSIYLSDGLRELQCHVHTHSFTKEIYYLMDCASFSARNGRPSVPFFYFFLLFSTFFYFLLLFSTFFRPLVVSADRNCRHSVSHQKTDLHFLQLRLKSGCPRWHLSTNSLTFNTKFIIFIQLIITFIGESSPWPGCLCCHS